MSFIAVMFLSLAVYLILCFCIIFNGLSFLKTIAPATDRNIRIYVYSMLFLSLSPFLGRFTNIYVLEIIGYYWLIIFAYSLILLFIANLIVFIFKRYNKNIVKWAGISIISILVFLIAIGCFNAWNPTVRNYEVTVNKESKINDINILVVSDIHLGTIVGANHLERLVDLVNTEKPDIVLIPGDVINDDLEPYLKENMGETMSKIKAPLGVYATLGNHDYYGDDNELIVKELEKAGITMLNDENELIEDSFYIIGRNDKTDSSRKNMEEMVADLDKTKPIIMLDHQPTAITEAQKNDVDILLSGHTHKGQITPGNFLTNMLFENDYGYLKKSQLHSFVSSGFGTWGPPIRIGSRSEVMLIKVHFNK